MHLLFLNSSYPSSLYKLTHVSFKYYFRRFSGLFVMKNGVLSEFGPEIGTNLVFFQANGTKICNFIVQPYSTISFIPFWNLSRPFVMKCNILVSFFQRILIDIGKALMLGFLKPQQDFFPCLKTDCFSRTFYVPYTYDVHTEWQYNRVFFLSIHLDQ